MLLAVPHLESSHMCIQSQPADNTSAGLTTMSERRPADTDDSNVADEPIETTDMEKQHASEATACENDEGPHVIPDPAAGSIEESDDSAGEEGQTASVSPEIGPGRLAGTRRILSVRTQHESLALRASFKSQLQLGLHQKGVRFSVVSIREYPIIIGDSPSTSRGVPLSLGWEYEPECNLDLDAYEATRLPGGECERRTKYELR